MIDTSATRTVHGVIAARGFTLVELMVTITVAAVLLALALPSFKELRIRTSTTQTANGLVADLNLARSEAVRRGTLVEVTSVSTTNKWGSGWSVKADSDPANARTFPTTIKNADAVSSDFSVCGAATGAASPAGDSTAIFSAAGSLFNANGMDIYVNRPDGNAALSIHIVISASGMITSTHGTSSC